MNKDDLRFRHLVRRTSFPRSGGARWSYAGVPNTLPPQDLTGMLSLAASDFTALYTTHQPQCL